MPPFDDEPELTADERCFAFSGTRLTEPPVSFNTEPFGAFFDYAARYWTYHLGGAPVDFSLDDVLKFASPTSGRQRAWAQGWRTVGSPPRVADINPLCLLAEFGNVSILEQLLDRLAPNGDGDRGSIVDAATAAIHHGNPSNVRALMNHPSTAMAMQTVEMLENFVKDWKYWLISRDDLKEWTKLITDLFDVLASDTIPSPNYLLCWACCQQCMPAIEKIFERAKADRAFQEKLMQPTDEIGPLGEAARRGDIKILRYLCQQDGIAEAHASNRDPRDGRNILGYCCDNPKVEIIELLLNRFPWLASERGGGDKALMGIINFVSLRPSEGVKTAKLLLQHTQATPGLVDVDELLTVAVRRGWSEMCRMLIVDGHADPRAVVKRSSSGQLEFKLHFLNYIPEPYRNVLEAIAGCLPDEVLGGITAAQETEDE